MKDRKTTCGHVAGITDFCMESRLAVLDAARKAVAEGLYDAAREMADDLERMGTLAMAARVRLLVKVATDICDDCHEPTGDDHLPWCPVVERAALPNEPGSEV